MIQCLGFLLLVITKLNLVTTSKSKIGWDCNIRLFREYQGLLRVRVRFQSRNVSSKSYLAWIKYDIDQVMVWYCRCRAGARTIGTYSHVASVS